jgi:hypothetical protein
MVIETAEVSVKTNIRGILPGLLLPFAVLAVAARSEQNPQADRSVQAVTLAASYLGTHNNERVGYCLAKAGDLNGDGYGDFIIGNYHHDIDLANWENKDYGCVYVILGKPSGFAQNVSLSMANARLYSNLASSAAGWSIGGNGDANGDGLPDILIGARHAPFGTQPGYVFLVFGRTQADWGNDFVLQDFANASYVGESNGSCLGTGVDFIGDVNGDGYDDFAMAANTLGKVYLFKGKTSGWSRGIAVASGADAIIIGDPVPGAEPGYWVRGLGDVNGDGIPDFVIGTQAEDLGGSIPYQLAKAYIFFGKRNFDWGKNFGISYADVIYTEETAYQWNGSVRHVAPAGDVNADGYDDLLVNAPKYPTGNIGDPNFNKGKTYLILGRPTAGWTKNNDLTQSSASWIGVTNGDWSSYGINGGLDLNGDGYDDFLIGAIQHDPTGRTDIVTGNGKVYWMKGRSSDWSNNVSLSTVSSTFSGEQSPSGFGWAVSPIGDFNQDGAQDFAVSAPFYNTVDFAYPIGKIYVYLGEKINPLIKGAVQYWKNNKGVPQATVKKDGTAATTTYSMGNYLLSMAKGSNAVISIAKDHGVGLGDTTVTSFDAALAARCANGNESLSGYQRYAADVNGDAAVRMNDAMQIARYAVDLEGSGTNKAGDWIFDPPQRSYTNLQTDQTGQNYVAVIRGDVDGGWAAGSSKTSAAYPASLETGAVLEGDTLRVSFALSRAVPLLSFDFAVSYDQGALSYCRNRSDAQKTFTVFENAENGILKLGGFTTDDGLKTGDLIEMVFAVRRPAEQIRMIRILRALLNQATVERDRDIAVMDAAGSISFGLSGNYPNPFNGSTMLNLALSESGAARLEIIDVRGVKIRTLMDGFFTAGRHSLSWDGQDDRGRPVPSGTYIIRLNQGSRSHRIKVLLLK